MATKSILIIDDHADTGLLVGARLKRYGYEPVLAVDAAQAVTMARQTRPDALGFDLGLPCGNSINWMAPVWFSHGQLAGGLVLQDTAG